MFYKCHQPAVSQHIKRSIAGIFLSVITSTAHAQYVAVPELVSPNGQCESTDALFGQAENAAPFGIPLPKCTDQDFREFMRIGSRCIAEENGGPADSFARTLIDQFEGKVRTSAANAKGLRAQEAARQRQQVNARADRERRIAEREAQLKEQATAAEGEDRNEAALATREADQARRMEAGIAEREKKVAELERHAKERARQIEELQRRDSELAQREHQARALESSSPKSALPQNVDNVDNRTPDQQVRSGIDKPLNNGPEGSSPIQAMNTHLSEYQYLIFLEGSLNSCFAEFGSYEEDRRKVFDWLRDTKQTGVLNGVPEAEFDALKKKLANDPAIAVMQLIDKHKGSHGRKKDCDGISFNVGLMEIARRSNAKRQLRVH